MLKALVFVFILKLFCKPDLKQDRGLLLLTDTVRVGRDPAVPAQPTLSSHPVRGPPVLHPSPCSAPGSSAVTNGRALCLLFPYNLRAFLTLIFLFLF